MTRIVHVSDCFAPRVGGIELQVEGLVRAQSSSGYDVHVITTTGGPEMRHVNRLAVPLYLRPLSYEIPVDPAGTSRIAALFDRLRPEIVHVHLGVVAPLAWLAVRYAVTTGIPTVVSVHSMWGAWASAMYRWMRTAARWTEWPLLLAPVSNAAEARVQAVVQGRVHTVVVPNGLNLAAWRPRKPRSPALHGLRLVTVSRLAPRKRIVVLLRILRAAAYRLGPDHGLRLTIVGEGPAEPLVRAYLERYRMAGWVNLAGPMDRHELPDVLGAADLFLAPATHEAFGLAALEARAVGLPVLAHRGTGVADFVTDGESGLLAADDREFSRSVVRVATDDALRGALTRGSAECPPLACDWPQVVARFDDCYADAAREVTRAR